MNGNSVAERVETACKVCGKPVVLSVDPDAAADPRLLALLKNVARGAVHDHCASWQARKMNQRRADELQAARSAEWGGVCPPLYQDTEEARLPRQKLLPAVMAWAFGGKGLLIHGATRTGKTRSMFLLLRREFDAGRHVATMTHSEFCAQVMSLEQSQRARWLDVLAKVDILFIDDLGKGRLARCDGNGSVAEECLFDVFARRVAARLPTMWTTQNRGKDIAAQMSGERGAAFVARLREFASAVNFGLAVPANGNGG